MPQHYCNEFIFIGNLSKEMYLAEREVFHKQSLENILLPKLILATQANHLEAMSAYLELGANPNGFEEDTRSTPLHFAAQEGYLKAAFLLLKAGADKNLKNRFGKTAIDLAKVHYHKDIALLLMQWHTSKW